MMFEKIFPKVHPEGYKFLIISSIITLVVLSISSFFGFIFIFITIFRISSLISDPMTGPPFYYHPVLSIIF